MARRLNSRIFRTQGRYAHSVRPPARVRERYVQPVLEAPLITNKLAQIAASAALVASVVASAYFQKEELVPRFDDHRQGVCASLSIHNLSGFGSGGLPVILLVISSNTNDYSMRTAAGSPAYPVEVRLTVNSGVTVGSTGTYAVDTGSGWATGSKLSLTNLGTLNGKTGSNGSAGSTGSTGAGGAGGAPGTATGWGTAGSAGSGGGTGGTGTNGATGGDALKVQFALTLTNASGVINGGTGGTGGAGGAGGAGGSGGGGGGAGSLSISEGKAPVETDYTGGRGGDGDTNSGLNTGYTGGTAGLGGNGGSSSGYGSAGSNSPYASGGAGGAPGATGSGGASGSAGATGNAINGFSLVTVVSAGTINGPEVG